MGRPWGEGGEGGGWGWGCTLVEGVGERGEGDGGVAWRGVVGSDDACVCIWGGGDVCDVVWGYVVVVPCICGAHWS